MKAHETISASDLKANLGRMLRAVGRGKSLTVTHRQKKVARLVPVPAAGKSSVPADDPIFRLTELAEPMGNLSNEQMDRLVYGG